MRRLACFILLTLLTAIGCTDHERAPEAGDAPEAAASAKPKPDAARNVADPSPTNAVTDEMLQQRAAALRKKHGNAGFTVVIEPPFVVIGDESAHVVRRRSENTVRWAVDRLKWAYFQRDPDKLITIWMFADEASYEKHTRAIFNATPGTPFGFYSSKHDALIMNIATGGGTLVHEIVHPYMAANFPECPAWFNEGLGSLYEQSRDENGRIYGSTNWRLAGLQRAIRNNRTVSIKTLCAMTDRQFYHDPGGLHYAQARYLCYDLQQRGVLREFYRRFRANHDSDPTGYKTLKDVLGVEDMSAYQREWEQRVLELEYP